jgi:hypothetical protein
MVGIGPCPCPCRNRFGMARIHQPPVPLQKKPSGGRKGRI